MDNNIIEAEWQEMKEQIALLKKTIERQDIVSDRLMRRAMKSKMRSLNREARFVYVLGAFALVYCNIVFFNMGLTLWFSLATTVFMLAAIGYTVWAHRGLSAEEISTGRLVEVGRKVARMKRMGQRWLRGVFPFLAVWFGWLVWEIWQTEANKDLALGMIVGGAVGGVVGGILGYMRYRNTQRLADEILDNIKDVCGE
ncbi:MAG: hypothetical protein ACI3X6_05550 [Alloprevotella sp.]